MRSSSNRSRRFYPLGRGSAIGLLALVISACDSRQSSGQIAAAALIEPPPPTVDSGEIKRDLAQGQTVSPAPKALTVVYEDGETAEVTGWTIEYKFGESDSPPAALFSYTQVDTTDLLVKVGETKQRGITASDERRIRAGTIVAIKFKWTKEDVRRAANITILLTDGQTVNIVTDGSGLTPAKGLLTEKKYFFGGGVCPCMWLTGKASLNGKVGDFRRLLSNLGRYGDEGGSGAEIVEIRFQK
ncbi:MAG: hypothetical protein HYS05_20445 [Acidobacteria bacterium]|nr:hypothetical protein [Acidobacteriota bacterium]